MLSADQASQFKENGYLVLRNVIPRELINKSLSEIESLLMGQWQLYYSEDTYPGMSDALICLLNRNKNYRHTLYDWINKQMMVPQEFAGLPLVKEILLDLNIRQPIFQMAAHRVNLPNEDHFLTEWHQDVGIMNSENSVTMWLPILPSDKTNGSIALLNKSHNAGVIKPYRINYRGHSELHPDIVSKYEKIWLNYNPGDLLIFCTKTIHNAMPNRSESCRWATIFRFEDGMDNKYFDLDKNPLHEAYIMKKSSGSISGFSEGDSFVDLADKDKEKVVKTYQNTFKK